MGGRGSSSGGQGKSQTLTNKEREQGIQAYQGGGAFGTGAYGPLNESLSKGTALSKESKKIDSALQQSMKRTKEEIVVHRGLQNQGAIANAAALAKGGKGTEFIFKPYTSTSKESMVARQFSKYGTYKYNITVTKGTKVIDVNKTLKDKSQQKGEKEVILNRGTKAVVTKVVDTGYDKTIYIKTIP